MVDWANITLDGITVTLGLLKIKDKNNKVSENG